MKMGVRVAMGLLGLVVSHAMMAQAPAGAPSGSNGICKDGSYSTAASKEGACRGHKGVQAWYGPATSKADKSSTAPASSKTTAPAAASVLAPAPVAAKPSAQIAGPMAAGAPAGSNGICNDGSYSTAASKGGACRGHKGVQSWYGPATAKQDNSATASTSPKTVVPAPALAPAPAQVAAKPSAQIAAPMPPTMPAQNTSSMGRTNATRVSTTGEYSQKQPAPGGGNGQVWVNTASNVYHCEGSSYYGKTKAGSYMSEADAKAKGARADAGKPCSK